MSVLVLGLNHKTAPVSLLEQLAVPPEQLPKALAALVSKPSVTEAVVLSTCNRVEAYVHVARYHAGMGDVRNFFCEWAGLAPEQFVDATYDFYDEGAAEHLFAVTAGLDSMITGERQIQLQVKQAFVDAEGQQAAGRVLQALFRRALRVGKRVRAETGVSRGASSMVDVGLEAAEEPLGTLDGRSVLVVGAGKMGGMVASRLATRVASLQVANRSEDKRRRLADRVGATELRFGELAQGLASADFVVCSTGAGAPVIDRDAVAAAMSERADRPLVLLDLAVPRDIDPGCADVPGVTLLDIEDVRDLAAAHQSTGLRDEVGKARRIVADEAERFGAWTRSVRIEPTISALRGRAEQVRADELDRFAGRLSGLDEREREAVEALSKGIVNTLLHEPTVRLKEIADARNGEFYAAALRELFHLPRDDE